MKDMFFHMSTETILAACSSLLKGEDGCWPGEWLWRPVAFLYYKKDPACWMC